jgi:hypothetical protein
MVLERRLGELRVHPETRALAAGDLDRPRPIYCSASKTYTPP